MADNFQMSDFIFLSTGKKQSEVSYSSLAVKLTVHKILCILYFTIFADMQVLFCRFYAHVHSHLASGTAL